jgi:hypothetical protein
MSFELEGGSPEDVVGRESTQQFVMTGARFVGSRKNSVHES